MLKIYITVPKGITMLPGLSYRHHFAALLVIKVGGSKRNGNNLTTHCTLDWQTVENDVYQKHQKVNHVQRSFYLDPIY